MKNFKSILIFVFLFQYVTCCEIIASEAEKFYLTTGIHNSDAFHKACALNYTAQYQDALFSDPFTYCRDNDYTLNEWRADISLELEVLKQEVNYEEDYVYNSSTFKNLIFIENSNFGRYFEENHQDKHIVLFSQSLQEFDNCFDKILRPLYPSMKDSEKCELSIVHKGESGECYVDADFDQSTAYFNNVVFYEGIMSEYFSAILTPDYSFLVEHMMQFYDQIKRYNADELYAVAIEQTALFGRIVTDKAKAKAGAVIMPIFLDHHKNHQYGLLGSVHTIHTKLAMAIHASNLKDNTISFFTHSKKSNMIPLIEILKGNETPTRHKSSLSLTKIKVQNYEGNHVTLSDYMKQHYPHEAGKGYSVHKLLSGYSAFMAFLNSVYLLENEQVYERLKETTLTNNNLTKKKRKKKKSTQITIATNSDSGQSKENIWLADDFINDLYNLENVKGVYNSPGRRKTGKQKLKKFFNNLAPESLTELKELVADFKNTKDGEAKKSIFIQFIRKAAELGFDGYKAVQIPSFEENTAEELPPKEVAEQKEEKKVSSSQREKSNSSKKTNPPIKVDKSVSDDESKEQISKTFISVGHKKSERRKTLQPPIAKQKGTLVSELTIRPYRPRNIKDEKKTPVQHINKKTREQLKEERERFDDLQKKSESQKLNRTQSSRLLSTGSSKERMRSDQNQPVEKQGLEKINKDTKRKRRQTQRPADKIFINDGKGGVEVSMVPGKHTGSLGAQIDDLDKEVKSQLKYMLQKTEELKKHKTQQEEQNKNLRGFSQEEYIKNLEEENELLKQKLNQQPVTTNDVKFTSDTVHSLIEKLKEENDIIGRMNQEFFDANQVLLYQLSDMNEKYRIAMNFISEILKDPDTLNQTHEHGQQEPPCLIPQCEHFVYGYFLESMKKNK
jgi:hypothetical protein